MLRQIVVVFLVMIMVSTSRIEMKPRRFPNEVAAATSHLYGFSDPRQSLKEKIILSQEQRIKKLNEMVQTLKRQLEFCRAITTNAVNNTRTSVTELLNVVERQ